MMVAADDGKHECPRPNCTARVRNDLLACRPHWFELPRDIRDRVWRAWTTGSVIAHRAAVSDAITYWSTKEVSRG
jgi:hypothetical protein